MIAVSPAQIQSAASEAAFGRPLITNVLRGHVVEAIVALALQPDWFWCSADYAGWDFEHADGLRLEVKQSAARQSWVSPRPNPGSFDIKARTGRWKGAEWIPGPGRNAHIYIFAWHGDETDNADHRDPGQWSFYVAATAQLPATQRISLSKLQQLTSAHRYSELAAAVRDTAAQIPLFARS